VFMTKVHGGQVFAKVMDFGIAGIEADSNTKLTLAGAVLGTPTYMSPEQAQGLPVDARSDLYSLGVMLFEMVTGTVPFAADSVVSLLLAQVSKPPPRLSEVHPELGRIGKLQGLLDRLLAKSPDERPRDASEVLTLVEQLQRDVASGLASTELGALPAARGKPTARAASEAETALDARQRPVRAALSFPDTFTALLRDQQRRNPRGVLTAGVALLGVVLAFALWPEGDEAAPAVSAAAAVPALAVEKPSDEAVRPEASRRAPRQAESRDIREPAAATRESPRAAQAESDSPPVDDQAPRANASTGSSARPFPRIQNAFDKIFGPTGGGGRAPSQAERRQALLARGPAHNNVAAAKRAYRAGQLNEQAYEDTIWVLKTRRARRIDAEKQNLRAGAISKDEYKRRVSRIDQEYEGS
jgi:hypothetical protein